MWVSLTDAFVRVLFTSSTSHPHPLCRSSHSQIFFKIDFPKNLANFTENTSCETCEIFKNTFFYRTPPVAVSIMLLFMNISSFTSPLPHFHYFLYSTVTFFVWRNTFIFISLLLHHYYHNNRIIHQDCCNRYDLLYCHFHDSYMY